MCMTKSTGPAINRDAGAPGIYYLLFGGNQFKYTSAWAHALYSSFSPEGPLGS